MPEVNEIILQGKQLMKDGSENGQECFTDFLEEIYQPLDDHSKKVVFSDLQEFSNSDQSEIKVWGQDSNNDNVFDLTNDDLYEKMSSSQKSQIEHEVWISGNDSRMKPVFYDSESSGQSNQGESYLEKAVRNIKATKEAVEGNFESMKEQLGY